MAVTITNNTELVQALAKLGVFEGAVQGVFDGLFALDTAGIAALTTITTPDATDEATAITLVNDVKLHYNALLATLKGLA